jgi:homoserine dehydrogenase
LSERDQVKGISMEPSGGRTLRVALLGCGTVGSQVFRLLGEQAADLAARVGARLQVAGVAVRDPAGRARAAGVPGELATTDAMGLVTRPDVDIVVEMIGGIEPARSLLLAAMRTGKSVVTANKALLGADSAVMHAAAREHGADLFYEAAVAGAIPLLRPLRESLAGDAVRRVLGIVNGTTNYILDRMDSSGAEFGDALKEAQALGYAEADPTADVAGFDAAAKAAILASLAFHTRVSAGDVYRQGITAVTAADIASARVLGCVVKLLAICERNDGGISVRVHPAMISREHPLASVRGAYNAVFVEAESAGRLMFYGAGAGGGPTASAVLGDLVVVARNRVAGIRGPDAPSYAELPVLPMSEAMTRYHVALDVADRPGVLAPVAEAFARHGVSIQAVRQEGRGDEAYLVIVTHTARESALAATVAELSAMESVRAVDSVLRVEGEAGE